MNFISNLASNLLTLMKDVRNSILQLIDTGEKDDIDAIAEYILSLLFKREYYLFTALTDI